MTPAGGPAFWLIIIVLWMDMLQASDNQGSALLYDKLELLQLQYSQTEQSIKHDVEWVRNEINNNGEGGRYKPKRKRGCRGGARLKYRRRKHRTPVPSLMFGNARSLRNKIDELSAHCKFDYAYRDCSIMAFSETWLQDRDSDSTVDIQGYSLWRHDRQGTTKQRGGGVCAYINERWCKQVTVKKTVCNDNIELISLTCRPFYLPREFNVICVLVVYIPPTGNYNEASDMLVNYIHEIENEYPEGVKIIAGDFNGCDISTMIPEYHQFVNCNTRGDHALDLLYCNVEDAYKVIKRAPLGNSDHCMLNCIPVYKQKLKRYRPHVMTVQKWSNENMDILKSCFECTDWDVLYDCTAPIDTNVDVFTSYVNFCVENVVPKKTVTVYPNNKPWVTKELKDILNEKKRLLSSADRNPLRQVQKQLNKKIIQAKVAYKDKIEDMFKSNRSKDAWAGLKRICGFGSNNSCLPEPDNITEFVNDLNEFYNRFEGDSNQNGYVIDAIEDEPIVLSEREVLKALRQTKAKKACGPDGVKGCVLKYCSEALLSPIHRLFQDSVTRLVIPKSWKISQIIPVPKKKLPLVNNDLRPVALTSVLMKSLERIIKWKLCEQVNDTRDPLQFAYCKDRNTEDATVSLLHELQSHLDKTNVYARVLFIDFSSAFNTIKPFTMANKLNDMNVSPNLIKWIHCYLTDRSQYVKFKGVLSDVVRTNTGAPQGCVLSPLLFTLYTNDCKSKCEMCPIFKYADDTAIVGKIGNGDESIYREVVKEFVDWCDDNHLCLNVAKTKEIIVDFSKSKTKVHDPVFIKGEPIEIVPKYKYLGVMINDKLSGSDNVQYIYKKCLRRVHYLRIMKNVNVSKTIISLFYKSVIESVLLYCIVCFYGNGTKKDASKLNKIVRTAKRMGADAVSLENLHRRSSYKLAQKILRSKSHPLNRAYQFLRSGKRLRAPAQRTSRFKNSFVPSSIRIWNHAQRVRVEAK